MISQEPVRLLGNELPGDSRENGQPECYRENELPGSSSEKELPGSSREKDLYEKLNILTDAAKYDVACTSSGTARKSDGTGIGSCEMSGICHSFSADGRCISLLKILFTNECIFDCKYCVNRRSNDVERASFTPDEVCSLTMEFYRRNYIEGLFLSSGIMKNPDYTMELIYTTLYRLRRHWNFQGYIHVKAIPGASQELILRTGFLADRMSVNLELPTAESLKALAPIRHARISWRRCGWCRM